MHKEVERARALSCMEPARACVCGLQIENQYFCIRFQACINTVAFSLSEHMSIVYERDCIQKKNKEEKAIENKNSLDIEYPARKIMLVAFSRSLCT